MTVTQRTEIERFFSKMILDEGCWEWTGHHDPKGYSRFWYDQSMGYAHRWSYEYHIGPIPEGLVIDHLCKNRGCLNPSHMEPVTRAENTRRQVFHNSLKTSCPRGHEYDYIAPSTGGRGCVECNRRRAREQKQRLREAAR